MSQFRKYVAAPSGRGLFAVISFALLGAGAVALSGTTSGLLIGLLITAMVPPLIFLVAFTADEFPAAAALLVIIFPLIGGFYFALVYAVLPHAGAGVGGAITAAGLLSAFVALSPRSAGAEHRPDHRAHSVQHAAPQPH